MYAVSGCYNDTHILMSNMYLYYVFLWHTDAGVLCIHLFCWFWSSLKQVVCHRHGSSCICIPGCISCHRTGWKVVNVSNACHCKCMLAQHAITYLLWQRRGFTSLGCSTMWIRQASSRLTGLECLSLGSDIWASLQSSTALWFTASAVCFWSEWRQGAKLNF